MYYEDVCSPISGEPALDQTTGEPLRAGTLSSGQFGYAVIARAIVDHGWALDWPHIEELIRLLRR